jgi:hypothetical protein
VSFLDKYYVTHLQEERYMIDQVCCGRCQKEEVELSYNNAKSIYRKLNVCLFVYFAYKSTVLLRS